MSVLYGDIKMEEIWKPYFLDNDYLISNLGRVKSKKSNKLLKIYLDRYGYNYVSIINRMGTKNGRAQKIMCIETGKVYGCIKFAAEELGVNQSTISGAISENYKVKGYTWRKIYD